MTTTTQGLVRGLRRWDLLALVLNSVIGAGIFGLPSRAYALAGTYSVFAFLVSGVAIILFIACFAEVGSRFKATGGPYLYARMAFGPVFGFEVGWLMWLARVSAFAAVCNLFIAYLSYFWPAAVTGLWRGLVIVGIVSSLTIINIVGVRAAAATTNFFTVGKLVPLIVLIVVGFFFADYRHYSFTMPPSLGSFSQAALLLVFAYTGFEAGVIAAGETRDPARHIPFALFMGIGIVMVVYVLVQAVCIGTLPQLATAERPLSDAALHLLGTPGAVIIAAGALLSVGGTMNVLVFGTPRLLFAMAEHQQLPRSFVVIHRRFHTPHIAILVTAILMLILTVFSTFISALTISTVIRLITYATTCAALPVLRRNQNMPPPSFSLRAGSFVSVSACVLTGWLISNSTWTEARLVGIAFILGLLLYVLCAVRKDALVHNEESATISSSGI